MNIEDIIALIDDDNKDEVRNTINNAVEKEKLIGVQKYQKKDTEALKLKSQLRDIGYDKDEFSDFDSFKQSISITKKTAEESTVTLASLKDQLDDMNNRYISEVAQKEKSQQDANNATIRNKLDKAIGNKLYGADALIDNIILKGSLDIIDDKIVDKEGNAFDTFVNNTLEERKDDIKNVQKPGAEETIHSTVPDTKSSFTQKLKARMN